MIELVEDHDAATGQAGPEMLQGRANDFIDPAIGKDELELKV